jgi:Raf kinase inhibitor-like YbhB/YbcL family protein
MRAALLALPALWLALAAGCGGGGEKVSGPPPSAPERIRITSPAFESDGTIPKRFTCDGENVSPALAWTGVPDEARELALLVEDPDAPGGTFVHWVLFRLDPGADGLAEGNVPKGARQGENSAGKSEYAGPCPREGDPAHRYEFLLYALSSPLDLEDGAPAEDVRAAVTDAAIARGRLVGRCGRG